VGTAFSAPNSVWNTSQFNELASDPTSESLVGTIANWGAHNMNGINTTAYSSPIYTVPAGQATVKVVLNFNSPALNAALDAVPIPADATVAAGNDAHMVVYQPSTNQMWEFWHMRQILPTPTSATSTATVTSGGHLQAGTYYYRFTALSADGETTPSEEALEVTVPTPESTVTISFRGVISAQGYKIYRGTEPNNVGYIGTLNQATNAYGTTVAFVDSGDATPGATPPTSNGAATPGQWHAGWAGHIADVSGNPGYYRLVRSASGTATEEPSWGATASSLPIADGMITLGDLGQGRIEHALQLLVPVARAGVHSFPAQRSDGHETASNSIPEGAHFLLSASVNCGEQTTPFMRAVCVAAQRYGLIVNDQTGGGLALRVEDPARLMALGETNPYIPYFTDAAGKVWAPYKMMAAFPWSQLRLLPMHLEAALAYHN
jgi:hypothetical protein